MARTAISSLVLCLVTLVQTGNAQIVRYGPGGAVRVRAPFVRVDVGPGGSYVRAPFTSVYRPRYWGDGRYSLNPDDLTQKTLPELRSSLVAHWTLLQQELGRFKNGASWQKHLHLPVGLIADSTDPVANPDPVEFKNVLIRFDRVAKEPRYGGISRLASFQATHRLLSVYLDRLMEAAPEMPPPPPPVPEMLPQPQPQLPGSQET